MFVEESQNDFADFLEFFFDLLTVFFSVDLKMQFKTFNDLKDIIWHLDAVSAKTLENWKNVPANWV